jgi:hypothetical protein
MRQANPQSKATVCAVTGGNIADIELSQQAREISDMAVQTVRLFMDGLFGEAKGDHVGHNDSSSGSRQRLHEFPIQESPGGIAMQENNGVTDTRQTPHLCAVKALWRVGLGYRAL